MITVLIVLSWLVAVVAVPVAAAYAITSRNRRRRQYAAIDRALPPWLTADSEGDA